MVVWIVVPLRRVLPIYHQYTSGHPALTAATSASYRHENIFDRCVVIVRFAPSSCCPRAASLLFPTGAHNQASLQGVECAITLSVIRLPGMTVPPRVPRARRVSRWVVEQSAGISWVGDKATEIPIETRSAGGRSNSICAPDSISSLSLQACLACSDRSFNPTATSTDHRTGKMPLRSDTAYTRESINTCPGDFFPPLPGVVGSTLDSDIVKGGPLLHIPHRPAIIYTPSWSTRVSKVVSDTNLEGV